MYKVTSSLALLTDVGIGFAVGAALAAANRQGSGGTSAHAAMAPGKEAMAGMQDARMISPDDGRSLDRLLYALGGKRVMVTSRFGPAGG